MSISSIVNSGRRLLVTTLLDRARIRDRVMVRDTTGGQRETFVERTQTIACRFVMPKSDDPVLNMDSVFGPTTMILLMPLGTLYEEGDRVRNMLDGSLFHITKDLAVPSELATIVRVGIRELD
jgi:hypothetical protein